MINSLSEKRSGIYTIIDNELTLKYHLWYFRGSAFIYYSIDNFQNDFREVLGLFALLHRFIR